MATQRTFSNAHCTAAALDRGATITSWHPHDGHEALFVTSDANPDAEFHGGIPVCAPWFAWGREETRKPTKHGLVRWVDWRFDGATELPEGTRASWSLTAPETAHVPGATDYPLDLSYRYEATFGKALDVALTISSPTQDCVVDDALHTYFLVGAVGDARVEGVTAEPIVVPDAHDEIYLGAAAGPVRIVLPDRTITITAHGAQDVVVWNPGEEYAAGLADFNGDEWARMLCVEVGNVREHAVTIPAGREHTLGMRITMD